MQFAAAGRQTGDGKQTNRRAGEGGLSQAATVTPRSSGRAGQGQGRPRMAGGFLTGHGGVRHVRHCFRVREALALWAVTDNLT